MFMGEDIVEIIDASVRNSVAVIVDSGLNVCKELFKFILVLLILYYFALRSFQLLDDILPAIQTIETVEAPVEVEMSTEKESSENARSDLEARHIPGETGLRIGPPDESLIQQRASLLEQLEIEAEYEENLNQRRTRESGAGAALNDQLISQIRRNSRETSQPSQTIKTSLGKKSKSKANGENEPATTSAMAGAANAVVGDNDLVQHLNIERVSGNIEEIVSGTRVPSVSQVPSAPRVPSVVRVPSIPSIQEVEAPSYDDQHENESFHRV